jgi:hypothetical protein
MAIHLKVVTPYGEIPWDKLSRLSDAEMKRLMKELVNKLYTFLCRQDDPTFLEAFMRLGGSHSGRWDEPEVEEDFVVPVERRYGNARRKGHAD